MSSISEKIEAIQKEIAQHSPEPEKVQILGVTKFQPLEKVTEAIKNGITLLGVNYVQEGEQLRHLLSLYPIRWHFIGHIQSRKAKLLADYDCVESLDRWEVAEKLNQRLIELGKTVSVLIEVNIGREPQKSGVFPEEVASFAQQISRCSQLKLTGLMAMPPFIPVEERRVFFKEMRKTYLELRASYPLEILSMGTSDDYQVALEEGANLIRLGTILFGQRPHRAV